MAPPNPDRPRQSTCSLISSAPSIAAMAWSPSSKARVCKTCIRGCNSRPGLHFFMLVFAHRGFCDRRVSENTVLAFERAREVGADGVEFDLRVSRDGEAVVVHDENLHRIAGDARRVRDLTAVELQAVVLRAQGSIPTLNDVTSAIPAPMQLDIEIKDRDAIDPLIRKLKTSAGLRERVIVSSFVVEDIQRIREELPDVRTLLLLTNWPLLFRGKAFWKSIQAVGAWAVGCRISFLNHRRVRALRLRGWKAAAWDDRPTKRDAKKIARLGVDVAIVYKPDACK